MPDDVEAIDSVDAAGATDSKPAKSSAPAKQDGVDYFKKYTGLNSAHSKLLTERDNLIAERDEALAQVETLNIQVKTAAKPLQTQLDATLKDLEAARTEANTLKTQMEADKARSTLKASLAEKYKDTPQVVQAWESGDLKDRTSFAAGEEGDKSFGEYMDRMATLLKAAAPETPAAPQTPVADPVVPTPDRRDWLGGATPQPTRPYRQDSNPSVDTISKQLMALDRNAPDFHKKYDELTAQMDKALG